MLAIFFLGAICFLYIKFKKILYILIYYFLIAINVKLLLIHIGVRLEIRNKLFLLVVLFVAVAVTILSFTIYLHQNSTINLLSINELDNKKEEKLKLFNNYINHNKGILESIKYNKNLIRYIKTNLDKEIVENLFVSYAYAHEEIFQFRYIDKNGLEKIRIDNYKKPVIIQQDKLQNKKGRYYFTDTMNKKQNEIYYSNIDLNVEKGKIEIPIVPTLRMGIPIVIDKQKKGIIIININMSSFLNKLQDSSLHNVNLIYDDGNIIVSKDAMYNWSRDFKLDKNIFNLYSFLPKDFTKFQNNKTDDYFISKLPIDSNNKVIMLLIPKEFKKYTDLYDKMKHLLYILIGTSLLFLPVGYYLAVYIENMYKKKLQFDIVNANSILVNSVINSTDDLIFYKDLNFNYIGCNKAFENFVGKKKKEIVGKTDFDLFEEEHALLFREMDIKMLESKEIRSNDEWVTYANNTEVFLHTKKIPFNYDEINNFGILGISRDITEIHLAKEKIKEQSYIDELTKALNRKSYNETINKELDLFKRYNTPFCIAMYDIDNFKSVNDTYGHDIGDKVLIEMTQAVQSHIRVTDKLFRVGGEEFIIIFPSISLSSSLVSVEHLRTSIESMQMIENKKVTVSIGLTQINEDDTVDTIYKRVDALLYNSKHSGKNKISTS